MSDEATAEDGDHEGWWFARVHRTGWMGWIGYDRMDPHWKKGENSENPKIPGLVNLYSLLLKKAQSK